MKFTLTIPQTDVQKAYAHVLEETTKQSELKGFRKGMAPQNLVEEKVGKQALLRATVEHILPQEYMKAVTAKNLKPIATPKVTPAKVGEGEDWVFEVEVAEAPEVDLGNYKAVIQKNKAQAAIWTPDKGDPKDSPAGTPKEDENQRLSRIFDSLLQTVKLEVPELLVEEEVNHKLSQLLNQVNKLGLTIDQYLSSINTNAEKIREEYKKTATAALKLEFILQKIAEEQNISVTDEEVEKLINATTDQAAKIKMQSPQEKTTIKAVLRKRKSIDYLLAL